MVLHLEFVSFEDQLYFEDHYVAYCQTALRYQKTEAQVFTNNQLRQEYISLPPPVVRLQAGGSCAYTCAACRRGLENIPNSVALSSPVTWVPLNGNTTIVVSA